MSFIFILLSLGSMSHADFKKSPRRHVEFLKGQNPQSSKLAPLPGRPLLQRAARSCSPQLRVLLKVVNYYLDIGKSRYRSMGIGI